MNYWLLLIPILTAFTGWFAVRLLGWLLFHPATPATFAGIRIQGLYYRQQQQLATQISAMMASDFSMQAIREKISNPENLELAMPLIREQLDEFFRTRLVKDLPYVAPFLGEKTIQSLKDLFIRELTTLFPDMMQKFAGNLTQQFDLQEQLTRRLGDPQTAKKLENMLRPPLRRAAMLGLLVGLAVGLVQLALAVLTS